MTDEPYALGKPVTLDDFTNLCGYFDPTHEPSHGYGCAHPENEDEGCCFSFSCPLASELAPSDPLDCAVMGNDQFSEGEWVLPWRLPGSLSKGMP